ncbi:MAG: J domain-containing protein [Myxococcales bacterium]|nr:J domain-containing protein [Myxococcales bacterium]
MRDPYKALGVDASASDAEIKKAYRRLAKQYHPDRNAGDKTKEAKFKDISAAYNILSDPSKRAQFDNVASGGNIPTGDLSEIFAQMFGGAGGQRRGRQGGGSPFGGMGGGAGPFGGGMGGSPFGGMGSSPFGGMGGRPQARPKPAPKERKIKAKDGSELTLRGTSIYSDLRITFDKAMTGVVSNVPTLRGVAKVRIPPGTSSGQKLRLKGKGHRSGNGAYGDHFVTVQIDVPKVLGEEGSELLTKLVELLASEKSKNPS